MAATAKATARPIVWLVGITPSLILLATLNHGSASGITPTWYTACWLVNVSLDTSLALKHAKRIV
jgi:hypothetical protein